MSTNCDNSPKCQTRDNPLGGFRLNTSGLMDRRTLHEEISNVTFCGFSLRTRRIETFGNPVN